MNRPQKASLLLGIAGIAVASNVLGRISQHKKQIKIMNQMAVEIKSLFRAYAKIQKGIVRGEYTEADLLPIEERLEFEIIAAHYE